MHDVDKEKLYMGQIQTEKQTTARTWTLLHMRKQWRWKKDEIYAGTYKNTWEHRRDIHKTKNKRMIQKQRIGQISAHANEWRPETTYGRETWRQRQIRQQRAEDAYAPDSWSAPVSMVWRKDCNMVAIESLRWVPRRQRTATTTSTTGTSTMSRVSTGSSHVPGSGPNGQ